jgi:hypothetical protein
MESAINLLMNEKTKLKPNIFHKFLSTEQQTVLEETHRLEDKILPIIKTMLIFRNYFKISSTVYLNANTGELVIIVPSKSNSQRSLHTQLKKIADTYHKRAKVVVCYLNAEDVQTQIDGGMETLVKVYAGDKALEYLFQEDKERNITIIKNELKKKIDGLLESISDSFWNNHTVRL